MKLRGLIFLVVTVLLLAACVRTPAAPTATPVQPSPAPQEATHTAYPPPTNPPPPGQQAYPAYPAVPAEAAETGPLYPNLAEGAEVNWVQASGMILNKEVTKVVQTHDKKVYLTLKDGRTVVTTEAEIDQIMQVIQQCGEACSTIEVATE